MDVRMIEKLKDKLCDELEKVSRKSSMSSSDLDQIHKLVLSIEKLMRIEEMDGGESQRGYGTGRSYGRMPYGRDSYGDDSYDDYGNSARRGEHYVRGHYSRAEAADISRDHMRKIMSERNMSDNDRRTIERAMDLLD